MEETPFRRWPAGSCCACSGRRASGFQRSARRRQAAARAFRVEQEIMVQTEAKVWMLLKYFHLPSEMGFNQMIGPESRFAYRSASRARCWLTVLLSERIISVVASFRAAGRSAHSFSSAAPKSVPRP